MEEGEREKKRRGGDKIGVVMEDLEEIRRGDVGWIWLKYNVCMYDILNEWVNKIFKRIEHKAQIKAQRWLKFKRLG